MYCLLVHMNLLADPGSVCLLLQGRDCRYEMTREALHEGGVRVCKPLDAPEQHAVNVKQSGHMMTASCRLGLPVLPCKFELGSEVVVHSAEPVAVTVSIMLCMPEKTCCQ